MTRSSVRADKHVLDPWLILGSSLYWASVILSFMFEDTSNSPAANPSFVMSSYTIVACLIALMLCCKATLSQGSKRRALATFMIFIIIVYSIGEVFAPRLPVFSLVIRLLYLIVVAFQMVLWGFAYASLEKTRACQNTCCAVLAATLLVLLIACVSKLVSLPYIPQAFNIIAAMILMSGRVYCADHHHHREQRPIIPTIAFLLTRFGFGFCMGFCTQVPQHISITDGNLPYLILGIATMFSALIVCLTISDRLYSAIPSLLIVGIASLLLPFINQGITALVALSAGFIWLAWAVLSAAQLSELKESLGVSELVICIVEKSLLSLSIVAGAFFYMVLNQAINLAEIGALDIIVVTPTWMLILIAMYIMARLVVSRKEDEYAVLLQTSNRQKASELYQGIAQEFHLSDREREVVEMMAEGYSRTYIRNVLNVSEGTVKAHVAHIYQKLQIHRKDDLLDLVETRRRARR